MPKAHTYLVNILTHTFCLAQYNCFISSPLPLCFHIILLVNKKVWFPAKMWGHAQNIHISLLKFYDSRTHQIVPYPAGQLSYKINTKLQWGFMDNCVKQLQHCFKFNTDYHMKCLWYQFWILYIFCSILKQFEDFTQYYFNK